MFLLAIKQQYIYISMINYTKMEGKRARSCTAIPFSLAKQNFVSITFVSVTLWTLRRRSTTPAAWKPKVSNITSLDATFRIIVLP